MIAMRCEKQCASPQPKSNRRLRIRHGRTCVGRLLREGGTSLQRTLFAFLVEPLHCFALASSIVSVGVSSFPQVERKHNPNGHNDRKPGPINRNRKSLTHTPCDLRKYS